MIKISDVKKLREETQAPIMECQKALNETKGDFKKAKELLNKWGVEKIATKSDRKTEEGLVESYIHANGKVGAMVAVLCETDFVARTDEFKKLVHEVALQVAAMETKDVKDLLKQPYIRDPKLTIEDLVKQTAAKLGENIKIKSFYREKI